MSKAVANQLPKIRVLEEEVRVEFCSCGAHPAARPAARNSGDYRGTWGTVPLVTRALEWGVAIATFLPVLRIVPCHCARLTAFLHPKLRKGNAALSTLKPSALTLWRLRRAVSAPTPEGAGYEGCRFCCGAPQLPVRQAPWFRFWAPQCLCFCVSLGDGSWPDASPLSMLRFWAWLSYGRGHVASVCIVFWVCPQHSRGCVPTTHAPLQHGPN